MRSDPWHPLHCLFQASQRKSDQHNQIRDKLHELCEKAAGLGNARIEPRDYLSVCAVRPDLSVCFDSGVHTVDVSSTDPCAPSLVAAAARRTLSAASAREQTKITQCGPMLAAFGVQFSPFVFEKHGGLGDKAMEFVDKLIAVRFSIPEKSWVRPGQDLERMGSRDVHSAFPMKWSIFIFPRLGDFSSSI